MQTKFLDRFSFLILLFTLPVFSHAQSGHAPQVPHKMTFAGIALTIRDDAREEIQKDVDALTRSPKFFYIKVERARSYFPIIEKIFDEEGVPDDLKYLVLQESALIPDAVSTSNAVGFWQFKQETAGEFGLKIDGQVDERMNIASATRGAAKYFKKSYSQFNNWILVIQSYQMGMGGTSRSLGTRYNGSKHMDITSDTYWYVKKFLAHKIAFEKAWEGIPQISLTPTTIKGPTSLDDLARKRGIPPDQLKEYNKWAKTGLIPADREYVVMLPAGELLAESTPVVIAVKSQKIESTGGTFVNINGLKAYRAGRGESLQSIATKTNLKLSRFIKWNEIGENHKIVEGQVYYLEAKNKSIQRDPYTANGKETLWSISQLLGIRQAALLKFNPELREGDLRDGMVIRVSSDNSLKRQQTVLGVDPRRPFEWVSGQ